MENWEKELEKYSFKNTWDGDDDDDDYDNDDDKDY
jgi:hypothetical protein